MKFFGSKSGVKLDILNFFYHSIGFFSFCIGAIITHRESWCLPYEEFSNESLPDQVLVVAPAALVLLIPPQMLSQKLSNTTKRDAGNAILNTKNASPIFSSCKAGIDVTMLWQL